jgi:hypothetical protein
MTSAVCLALTRSERRAILRADKTPAHGRAGVYQEKIPDTIPWTDDSRKNRSLQVDRPENTRVKSELGAPAPLVCKAIL